MSYELRGFEAYDDKRRMDELISLIKVQIDDEKDSLALMSNATAFMMAAIADLNWAGFYFLRDKDLVLGPFQGQPACTRLSLDNGVCAAAFTSGEVTKVDDVEKFPGHVACDSASRSELVIPLYYQGEVYGVLDIDSPKPSRFTDIELEGFREIARLLEKKIYLFD